VRLWLHMCAGLNYDINPAAVIAWEFVSCAPLINGEPTALLGTHCFFPLVRCSCAR